MNNKTNDNQILQTSESVKTGLITGVVEVFLNYPFWTLKTRSMCELPLTFDPRTLYRGFSMALLSSAIITSLQITSSATIQGFSTNTNDRTSYSRITSAFLGGAITAMMINPLDVITTQLHKQDQRNYFAFTSYLIKKIGIRSVLFTGMPASIMTDGLFTAGYYGVYPYLVNKMTWEKHPVLSLSAIALLTGTTTAMLTLVPDMIKTRQHESIDIKKLDILDAARHMYQQKQYRLGFFARTMWATSYVGVAAIVSDQTEKYYIRKNK